MKALYLTSDSETKTLRTELERRGFAVSIIAWDPGEPVDWPDPTFDLLILDWESDSGDLPGLLKRLRTRGRPGARLLVIGPEKDDGGLMAALAAGADDLLARPIEVNRLRERLMVIERQITARPDSPPTVPKGPIPPTMAPPDRDEKSLVKKLSREELELVYGSGGPPIVKPGNGKIRDLYKRGQLLVLDSIWRADAGQDPDIKKALRIADRILDSLAAGGNELLLLATNRRQSFTLSAHCVNLAILATRLGHTLRCGPQALRRLGAGALLHEVGVVELPTQLIYKPGPIKRKEIRTLRSRPAASAKILQGLGEEYRWLPPMVGQIFEREDGSGRPLGLSGTEICEEAKLLGIADVFEACIHIRPYRPALTGYQLLHELTSKGTKLFSKSLVKALIETFTLYPYNEHVVLNTGEIGKVVDVHPENLVRPVIELLYDENGEPLVEPKQVRLEENPSLSITKAIAVDSLPTEHGTQDLARTGV